MILTPGNKRVVHQYLMSCGDELLEELKKFGEIGGVPEEQMTTIYLHAGVVVTSLMKMTRPTEGEAKP